MPDIVCIGQTKHYNVDPNPIPGSTYTWRIDGVVQAGFTTNEFDHTWNIADTYLIEVQERSADGCLGPVRSGQVVVSDNILPAFTQLRVLTASVLLLYIAYDFNKRHYWYLERCCKHRCYWFDGVYIHANLWLMCYSGYYDRRGFG